MKVKSFLNKLMLRSSIDKVRIERNGYTQEEFDYTDLRLEEYGKWGSETVKTFAVYDKVLVVNI